MQKAKYQAIRPMLQHESGIFQTDLEFCFRVAEASLAGADHRHDRQWGFPLCYPQRPQCRRQSAVEQIAVEFHPVGAGMKSFNDVLCTSAADFDQDSFSPVHACILSSYRYFDSVISA